MRRTIQDKEAALDLACAALTVELLDVGNPKTVEKAQKIADAAAAVAHAASEVRRHALRVARQLKGGAHG